MEKAVVYSAKDQVLSVYAIAPGVREIVIIPDGPGPIRVRMVGIPATACTAAEGLSSESMGSANSAETTTARDRAATPTRRHPAGSDRLTPSSLHSTPVKQSRDRNQALDVASPARSVAGSVIESEADSETLEYISLFYAGKGRPTPRSEISFTLDNVKRPRPNAPDGSFTSASYEAAEDAAPASPAKSIASSVTESEADSEILEHSSRHYGAQGKPIPRHEISQILDNLRPRPSHTG